MLELHGLLARQLYPCAPREAFDPLSGTPMSVTYYKRFRMEIDLSQPIEAPGLPRGYFWIPWDDSLVDLHAEVKYQSFKDEIDAHVFQCLGERFGCQRLMRDIWRRDGFLPSATWMVAWSRTLDSTPIYCGTIQGVLESGLVGSVQNLGVVPAHRGRGLGTALVQKAMLGFQEAGIDRMFLEVTAQNLSAIRLYRGLGFRKARTLYKAVEVA